MTKLCNSCEYLKYCARSGIEKVGCDRYKKDTTTNEEWFDGLSTEEKAKVFANATYSTAVAPMEILVCGKEFEQKKWEMWLKQPHTNKE